MGAESEGSALWLAANDVEGRWVICEGELSTVEVEKVRSLYCATKPMVAMGVLALLERHGVDWTSARVDAHGQLGDDGPWALTDLAAHRTPLVRPTFWEVLRLPLGSAESELAAWAVRAAAAPGGPAGNSEVLAWYVLSRAAAAVAGEGWAGELQTALRAVVGPRLWLVPDRELLDLPVDAMVTLTAARGGTDVPLVYALSVRSRALTSPYLGGYGSFAAVLSWFQALRRHLRGEAAPSLFPAAEGLWAELAAAGARGKDGGPSAAMGLEAAVGPVGGPRLALQAAGGALVHRPGSGDGCDRRRAGVPLPRRSERAPAVARRRTRRGARVGAAARVRGPLVTAGSAFGRSLRDLLGRTRFPSGLPPLPVSLHLAVVVLDQPDSSVAVLLGPGWTVATTDPSPELVHDAVLAAPAALVREILTGTADPGLATVHGSLTGSLVGQSALALLVEAVSGIFHDEGNA